MTRTYLVTIEQSPTEDTTLLAEEINQILLDEGIPVISTRPWASPNDNFTDPTASAPLFPTLG